MKAIIIDQPGEAGALTLADLPTPRPGPGEILIRTAFAGVNRADCLQRRNRYPLPGQAVPGLELSGIVAESRNARFAVGDAVCALVSQGAYAEYCAAPAAQALPLPKGVSLKEAASLPEAFATAWMALAMKANLKANERVLIHGGASGIGIAAIQLARHLGAEVFATAGSAAKQECCEQLGARALNYRQYAFPEWVMQQTQGQGVNVVLDMVGGDYTEKNLRSLAQGGRLVQIAYLGGAKAALDLNLLLMRNLAIDGMTLRSQPAQVKAQVVEKLEETVWPAIACSRIRCILDHCFTLENAQDAHKRMENNLNIGKIVLQVSPSP